MAGCCVIHEILHIAHWKLLGFFASDALFESILTVLSESNKWFFKYASLHVIAFQFPATSFETAGGGFDHITEEAGLTFPYKTL